MSQLTTLATEDRAVTVASANSPTRPSTLFSPFRLSRGQTQTRSTKEATASRASKSMNFLLVRSKPMSFTSLAKRPSKLNSIEGPPRSQPDPRHRTVATAPAGRGGSPCNGRGSNPVEPSADGKVTVNVWVV